MLVTSLPRVLGCGETASVAVNVFAMEDGVKSTTVSVESDPIVICKDSKTIQFSGKGDQLVQFPLKALESEVHRLVKVTNAQATEINAAIRQRAAEVCKLHRAEGCEKAVAAAIRKSLKATCGTGTVRDLPRCDYSTALRLVQLWDDYAVMQAIKGRR